MQRMLHAHDSPCKMVLEKSTLLTLHGAMHANHQIKFDWFDGVENAQFLQDYLA